MSTKNRKRHQKAVNFCSFCGNDLKNDRVVLSPGVFVSSECENNVRAFFAEVGGAEYGYKTTDGRTGVISVATI